MLADRDKEKLRMQRCREAVAEDDPERMTEIVDHVNRMLYEKQQTVEQQIVKKKRSKEPASKKSAAS